jgi:maleate isomerase
VPLGVMGPGGAMDASIALAPVRAFADPPLVDDAAELLAAAPLNAIVFAFTSSSYARGADDDAALRLRLEHRARGIPVVITCAAAVQAMRALEVNRLAVIDPPWFPATLSAMGAAYFSAHGVEVVYAAPAGLPSSQHLIHPELLYTWARARVPAEAEAVFIGGNGFRAVGVIQALEEVLGRPVMTANQVAFWQALHLAGARVPVVGYGTLFARTPPTP